ncbi:MAG: DNA polymerase III subunit beta [Oscillospiraceae bacterium]|jgi:DNA polymerase-3 subunit beta|nr:DNA polymerase III subunit beta [Oscillospiraceae bacterium]
MTGISICCNLEFNSVCKAVNILCRNISGRTNPQTGNPSVDENLQTITYHSRHLYLQSRFVRHPKAFVLPQDSYPYAMGVFCQQGGSVRRPGNAQCRRKQRAGIICNDNDLVVYYSVNFLQKAVFLLMKFSCLANELSIALQNASKVVAVRSTLAALEGLLLEVAEDQVCLVGYNFDIALTTTIDAKVNEPGKIVFGAKLLTEIMRRISDGIVHIETTGLHIKITNNNSVFNIVGLEAQDYPELPVVSVDDTIVMDAEKFKNLVNKTIYAVSTDETRLIYTGALMNIEASTMTLVALDGFRLATKKEPIRNAEQKSIICPGKSLQEVARLISAPNQDIFIDISKSYIMFRVNNYKVISKLLEGTFLDYETTIPKEFCTKIIVNTQDFIACIERASVVVQDKLKAPITLAVRDSRIHLSCEGAIGCATDELLCSVEGDDMTISFNSRLLLDALKACGTKEVCFDLSGNLSPVVLRAANDGADFLFLVLPVRTNNDSA